MTSRTVENCGSCGSAGLESVLWLGYSPITCGLTGVGERLGEETYYPLELLRCSDCSLVQLSCVVDREAVFSEGYTYASSNNSALRENFVDLARRVPVEAEHLVVDVGANDGTLLTNFDCRRVAVDPTDQVQKAPGHVMQEPFGADTARRIVEEHGHAKVVTACNVLAHVENIHEVLDGISILLRSDGVLVTENHHLAAVVAGQWDTIYHEHLRYYSPRSLELLLAPHGLAAFRHQSIKSHGGSLRTFARKHAPVVISPEPERDWEGLRTKAATVRRVLRQGVSNLRVDGRRIAALSATARATTIASYCGLSDDDLECVYEVPGSEKIDHYIPGTRIPIRSEAELSKHPPDYLLLFAWHLRDVIVPKLTNGGGYRGGFIVPLPRPEVVHG